MGDTVVTIIAIFLAAILMFVFPLMSTADRNDDVAQTAVQSAVVEFVDNVRTTGKITTQEYSALQQTIAATGNSYDVDMEVQVLDENPGKKVSQAAGSKIGENIYYSIYSSQIESELQENGYKNLKEGDIINVKVKNTNTTISQMLKNFFYTITGKDTYQIAVQHAGVVMANGSKGELQR